MEEDSNQVLIERGRGKQTGAGSVIFRARYKGFDIALTVSAAVLDGFHLPLDANVSADEWSEAAYADIEKAATRKAEVQEGGWDTLDIEVRDLR